jgi:hypothetical protein
MFISWHGYYINTNNIAYIRQGDSPEFGEIDIYFTNEVSISESFDNKAEADTAFRELTRHIEQSISYSSPRLSSRP